MKLFVLALAALVLSIGSFSARAEDADDIKLCLTHWAKSPFTADSDFRVVSAKVKVMGIGSDINESKKTAKPELVLIRPAVTVMAKTVMNLGNPNGWYCLKGEVAVMGKMEINLNCDAHLASSKGGTTVMGSDEHGTGTTVMGSTQVNRVACAKADDQKESVQ